MKQHATKKLIRSYYKNIIEVSYCNLYHLLEYENPVFYLTRVEGWAADVYELDNDTCIVTGYAAWGNIKNRELEKEYEQKARVQAEKYYFSSFKRKKAYRAQLLKGYLNKILKGVKK